MLIIDFGTEQKELTWYVGQKFDPSMLQYISRALSVYADGDEFIYIISTCKGIFYSESNAQQWHGDSAKNLAWYIVYRNS